MKTSSTVADIDWVRLTATVSPPCLATVAMVTVADVEADIAASLQ